MARALNTENVDTEDFEGVNPQNNQIIPVLGNFQLPDYSYTAYHKDQFHQIKLSKMLKDHKYLVLIFYPYDFEKVCASELIKFSENAKIFKKYKSNVLFVSVDSEYSHRGWSKMDKESGGVGELAFPMVSDSALRLSTRLSLYDEVNLTTKRGTAILNSQFDVLHLSYNFNGLGRSTNEIFRILSVLNENENGHHLVDHDPRTN